jgi:hypothetical protein
LGMRNIFQEEWMQKKDQVIMLMADYSSSSKGKIV